MKRALALMLIAAAPLPAGRSLIGRYAGWAAFRDAVPAACYAIAEPDERRGGERPPFLAFARRPDMAGAVSLHLRLSHARKADTPVVLAIGDGRFALAPSGEEAWASSPRDDARILAALRAADTLTVTATGARGGHFADAYALAGAASAIDAALLGCPKT